MHKPWLMVILDTPPCSGKARLLNVEKTQHLCLCPSCRFKTVHCLLYPDTEWCPKLTPGHTNWTSWKQLSPSVSAIIQYVKNNFPVLGLMSCQWGDGPSTVFLLIRDPGDSTLSSLLPLQPPGPTPPGESHGVPRPAEKCIAIPWPGSGPEGHEHLQEESWPASSPGSSLLLVDS